jgi:hypothetical protein
MALIYSAEQWLELSLMTLDEYPRHKVAWRILEWYLTLQNGEISRDELIQMGSDLHVAWKVRQMVTNGLLEYDFEKEVYRRSSEGIKLTEALNQLSITEFKKSRPRLT